jgi:hypothetical protein
VNIGAAAARVFILVSFLSGFVISTFDGKDFRIGFAVGVPLFVGLFNFWNLRRWRRKGTARSRSKYRGETAQRLLVESSA